MHFRVLSWEYSWIAKKFQTFFWVHEIPYIFLGER